MANNASGGGLDRARSRRRDLRVAMEALEIAVAKPSRDEQGWLDVVGRAVAELSMALRAHVDEVEGPEGLLTDIVSQDPRLSVMAEELRREHPELLTALERVEKSMSGGDHRQVRRRVVTLLGRLTMHRQSGADLVYEAYQVDIGGQG